MPQKRRQRDDKRGKELLEAALEYARAGIPVIPLHSINQRGVCTCGRPDCDTPGKHPWRKPALGLREGLKDATTNEDRIREWSEDLGEKANIGGVLGDHFVAIDVDVAEGKAGEDSQRDLEEEFGAFPRTATAKTGKSGNKRGRHYYFKAKAGINSVNGYRKGIDVRGHRGYVVLPPSRHYTGVDYEWEVDLAKAAAMPEALEAALRSSAGSAAAERDPDWEPSGLPTSKEVHDLLRDGNWPIGEQRAIATRCSRALLGSGADPSTVVDRVFAALDSSDQNPDNPWTQSAVERLVDSEVKNPPPPLNKKPREQIKQSLTDTGNAERFAQQFSDVVRFVPEWKSWVFWSGNRWQKDAEVLVTQKMQAVARRIALEVEELDADDDDLRKLILLWARKSLEAPKIKAAVEMAKAQAALIARPGEFDRDRHLLNCWNGTLDLRTGELRPHRREDMLTRQVRCDFDPDATSEDWERVLRDAFDGDEAMIAHQRRALGYSLTGETSEEKFFLYYGKPGAGKGTILDSFQGMLGDYAANISAKTLTKTAPTSGGAASEDVARLDGARFVLANEFDPRDDFNAPFVSALTGRDKIAARLLYKGTFEFYPQFKIFIAANHLPKQPSSPDSGVWRRLQVVPFDHAVAKIDKELKTRLGSDDARSAILSWALAGCLEWQQDGLGDAPAQVAEALDDYREASDPHLPFIESCIEKSEGNFVPNKVMWDAYQAYCAEEGIRMPVRKNKLTEILKERGFEQKRQRPRGGGPQQRVWIGVRIKGASEQVQRSYEEGR